VVKAPKANASKVAVKRRVLVVDDSLTMRKVLARLLEREGFEVLVAKDGLDAMQLLQETTPDVILTDIEMPRMDGFGLARNIRDDARTVHTPLIMISSRTADKHQNLAKDIGVDAFFGKPVQDDDLINKVNELIINKRSLH
jgi:chemosensory pili system protein ChpA (sensor histidine kinase/response regulator)